MREPRSPWPAGEARVAIDSEHLAAIVRSSEDAILSKDRNAVITSWNGGAEKLYGYSVEEAVGQPVSMLIPPELVGEERVIVDRILRGERVDNYDTVRVRKDGRRVHVALTASPLHAPDGEIVGVSIVARDISGTAVALEDAEERFRRAFHDAPIGMAVLSVQPESLGEIQEANEALSRLLGYGRDELEALAPDELAHPDDDERERPLLEELASRRREGYGIEKRHRHKDGHLIWIWVTVSQLGDDDPPRYAVAQMLDISERKRAEEELASTREDLERSNAELDQFAYVASHDLKEPLILVSAYARMLEERHGAELDEEGRTFLGHIRDEAGRMKAMIDDLLDYSRLESRAVETEPVDLAETVADACRTLAPKIEQLGARIDVREPLPTLEGTQSQFERLFRNLLSNALKFQGDAPPVVTVWAERAPGDEWVVAVRDNGIGIDPAKAERVFEVFQRLHSQERYVGTGMGLAICKRIVERHGGRIWVEPAEGGGSLFQLSLPG